jgi:hypothetical protein
MGRPAGRPDPPREGPAAERRDARGRDRGRATKEARAATARLGSSAEREREAATRADRAGECAHGGRGAGNEDRAHVRRRTPGGSFKAHSSSQHHTPQELKRSRLWVPTGRPRRLRGSRVFRAHVRPRAPRPAPHARSVTPRPRVPSPFASPRREARARARVRARAEKRLATPRDDDGRKPNRRRVVRDRRDARRALAVPRPRREGGRGRVHEGARPSDARVRRPGSPLRRTPVPASDATTRTSPPFFSSLRAPHQPHARLIAPRSRLPVPRSRTKTNTLAAIHRRAITPSRSPRTTAPSPRRA